MCRTKICCAIWAHSAPSVHAPILPNLPPIIVATETIGDHVFFAQNRAKDIAHVRNKGFEVDDDNINPAPQNVPGPDALPVVGGGLFEEQSWGWDGIDHRQTAGEGYDKPTLHQGFTPIGKTYLQFFMHFFLMMWFSDILL